jgi:hypothetical protein
MELIVWTAVAVAISLGVAERMARPRGTAPVIRYRG